MDLLGTIWRTANTQHAPTPKALHAQLIAELSCTLMKGNAHIRTRPTQVSIAAQTLLLLLKKGAHEQQQQQQQQQLELQNGTKMWCHSWRWFRVFV